MHKSMEERRRSSITKPHELRVDILSTKGFPGEHPKNIIVETDVSIAKLSVAQAEILLRDLPNVLEQAKSIEFEAQLRQLNTDQ